MIISLTLMPMTASAASYKPGKAKITSLTAGKVSKVTNEATVTIKWKKVSKATGYQVYTRNDNGKWVVAKKVGKTAAKPSGKRVLKAAIKSKPVRGFLIRKAAKTLLHGAFALGVLYLVARYKAEKKRRRYRLRKAIARKARSQVSSLRHRNNKENERRRKE